MSLYLSQKKLLILLLAAFFLGFLLGLLYDVFRILRRARKPKKKVGFILDMILVSIEDLLFFAFGGVVFSILFFVANSGKVRPSAFVMAVLGFLMFRLTLSRVSFPLSLALLRFLKRVLLVLSTPFVRLGKLIRRKFAAFFRKKAPDKRRAKRHVPKAKRHLPKKDVPS